MRAPAAASRCLALLALCVHLFAAAQRPEGALAAATEPHHTDDPPTIHIATTACGPEAAEEVVPLLKSIAIHASPANRYVVHIFMGNETEFPYVQVWMTTQGDCLLSPTERANAAHAPHCYT